MPSSRLSALTAQTLIFQASRTRLLRQLPFEGKILIHSQEREWPKRMNVLKVPIFVATFLQLPFDFPCLSGTELSLHFPSISFFTVFTRN